MKLIEKNKDGAEPVHMSWDAAQDALASGVYDIAPAEGERDIDQPGAQSPAPGTDPVDGEEKAHDGQILTNMTAAAMPGLVATGLPKAPPQSQPAPAKSPASPSPTPEKPQPAPAKATAA